MLTPPATGVTLEGLPDVCELRFIMCKMRMVHPTYLVRWVGEGGVTSGNTGIEFQRPLGGLRTELAAPSSICGPQSRFET